MAVSPWLTYAAGIAGIGVVSRLWTRFKQDRAARRRFSTPLFEQNLLDAILAPHESEGDDPNVLAEMSAALTHLNRRSYAEEFWTLDKQLAAYYAKVPKASRPTMRRALVRMLVSNNRWLQVVAAKTCASASLPEAIPPLRALLETGDPLTYSTSKAADIVAETGDMQYLKEIEAALNSLETATRI